jgi:phytoene dehydrogenase-like protein
LEADVVVVGAGHNGLVAAALLAREGLDVLVLERRDVAGGAIAEEELVPGHMFPTCAYALHLLHERVVEEVGLALPELRPVGEKAFVLRGEVVRESEVGERIGDEYVAWNNRWERAVAVVDQFVLREAPSADEVRAAVREADVEDFLDLSYDQLLVQSFHDEPARRLLAPTLPIRSDRPGSPLAYAYFRTETVRAERYQGVPVAGMRAVADAFAAAAELAGVRIEYGCEVTRLRGDGVDVGGRSVRARAVLSCLDPARTAALAGYAVVFDAEPPATKIHVVVREQVPVDGLTYVLDDDGLIEVQPHDPQRLSLYLPFARPQPQRALARVRQLFGVDGEVVVHEPDELERRLALTGGSIHHGTQGALDRPGPETPISGLFLCGAGAHPGGEVSGVPGWHAANAVRRIL